MQRSILIAAVCASLSGTALFADFSYDQTSQMTGGFMARLPGFAGGNKMREPQRSSIVLKGNRLAHIYAEHASITDLDKETITEIRFKEKTYSVMTFAEMKQMMESVQTKKKDANTPDVEFDIDIKSTGQSKVVGGYNANETIMTFKMKSTDPRTGKESTMIMVNDMWLVKDIPGYKQIQDFYKRMAEKANWMPQGGASAVGPAAGMAGAMQAAMKNAQKLEGVPVLHITRMRPEGMEAGNPNAQAGAQQQQAEQQQQPQQTPQQVGQNTAEQSAGSAIAGRLGRAGGLAGGLGGLRRKKADQQETPPPPPPPAQQKQAPPPSPAAAGDTSLMEMTVESSSFSNAPADGAKLEVPSGFKLVQKKTGR